MELFKLDGEGFSYGLIVVAHFSAGFGEFYCIGSQGQAFCLVIYIAVVYSADFHTALAFLDRPDKEFYRVSKVEQNRCAMAWEGFA